MTLFWFKRQARRHHLQVPRHNALVEGSTCKYMPSTRSCEEAALANSCARMFVVFIAPVQSQTHAEPLDPANEWLAQCKLCSRVF